MISTSLDQMVKGWFVGDFEPSLMRTSSVEVAVKEYKKGYHEAKHYHKIATEITVITVGRVRMNNKVYKRGDIVIVKPCESTDFEALEDSITTVVKYPSICNDKYDDERYD
jgi:hypothetical protein